MPNGGKPRKDLAAKPPEGVAEAMAQYAAALGPHGAGEFTSLLNQVAPIRIEDHCDLWQHVSRHPGVGRFVVAAMKELTTATKGVARFELRWSPPADEGQGEPVLCVRLGSYPKGFLRELAQLRSRLRGRGFANSETLAITTDFGSCE